VVLPTPPNDDLKLIDFGLSKHITSAKTLGVGTPGFLPPETILRTAPDGRLVAPDAPYDPRKVDSWAIGATLYLMVEGRYPFDLNNDGGRNVAAMLKAQVKGVFRPLQDKFRGTALEDLICHLLDPNPTTRFSLEDIKTHPWVQAGLETSSVPPVATAAPRPAPLQEQVQTLRGINTAPVVCGGLAGPGGRAAGL